MKKIITALSVAVLFIGCADRKKPGGTAERAEEAQDSVAVSESFERIVSAQEQAFEDTAYAHSDAYRAEMEKQHRMIAEKTKGMPRTAQLLYKYEIAVANLNKMGRYASQHPGEMAADERKQQLMKQYGHEAMQLYEQLSAMQLSAAERRRFEALNKKKD
jgi:hypothetical protein